MGNTGDLARRLVEYDERLAADVLEMICTRLGGPAEDGDATVPEMRDFLSDPEQARLRSLAQLGDVDDSPASTSEWKSQFSRSERLRELGLALAQRLGPTSMAR